MRRDANRSCSCAPSVNAWKCTADVSNLSQRAPRRNDLPGEIQPVLAERIDRASGDNQCDATQIAHVRVLLLSMLGNVLRTFRTYRSALRAATIYPPAPRRRRLPARFPVRRFSSALSAPAYL